MRAMLCRHGIAVLPELETSNPAADNAEAKEATAEPPPQLLPNPGIEDSILSDQIPLTISINQSDLVDFHRGNAFAATFFGPESLAVDKIQNEDFALAGVIEADNGGFPFGIVADGVTSKTFWSARASRIAAFAAYEALKQALCDGWRPEKGDAGEIDPLVHKVAENIDRRFHEDR